ncbi:MAG: hypothetical protein FWC27_12675 [Firmicutes bacterium]|nr:hypothetical protein [Bacillota bacterium]
MNRILKTKKRRLLCAAILLVAALAAGASVSARAADNPLMLTVRQVFVAASPSADDTFTYRLRPLDAGSPMPAGSTAEGYTFTIAGTGSTKLGPLAFSRSGGFRYEIFQIPGGKPGYTYDKRKYIIEVYAGAASNVELIVLNTDGAKAEAVEFRNTYGALPSDPALMEDPPVKKTVSGNPGRSSVFTFTLTARDASDPMPEGSVNGVKTIQITGSGEGNFGTWRYDKAGTYYYTAAEANTGEAGYTYDTAVYHITDTVTERGGLLVASRVVANGLNKPVTALTFINKYSAGKDGPKTGDDMSKTFYTILFAAGCVSATCAAVYLIASGKRKVK